MYLSVHSAPLAQKPESYAKTLVSGGAYSFLIVSIYAIESLFSSEYADMYSKNL